MNSTMPELLFTVVIPTYNYAGYISTAIDSVLDQTERSEIIVIDDGSTDDTRNVVAKYADKVKYVFQENKGVSAARNHGSRIASNEYIVFLDSDDTLLPNALSIMANAVASQPNTDVFIAGRTSVRADGKIKTSTPKSLSNSNLVNFKALIRRKLGSVTLAAIKKSVFDTISFPEILRNNEDIVFTAHALTRFKCGTIQEPIIRVNLHDDSLRHQVSTESLSLEIADILFSDRVLPNDYLKYKTEYSSRVLLSRFRALYLSGQRDKAKNAYHQAIKLFPKHIFLVSYLKKYLKLYL